MSDKRRAHAVSSLEETATAIRALAQKHGLPDFSPHGIEVAKQKAWEAKVLAPVQARVDAILTRYKAQILALIPGASVKYRGSLASGWKGPHKLSADGAALRFDPSHFDCDAFIEVPAATWAELGRAGTVPAQAQFVSVEQMADPLAGQLSEIQDAIAKEMANNVPGYKKVRGVDKFEFRVQSVGESNRQIAVGKSYPDGSIAKAGMPETESRLRSGTAYVDDTPVPGKIMEEVHHGV